MFTRHCAALPERVDTWAGSVWFTRRPPKWADFAWDSFMGDLIRIRGTWLMGRIGLIERRLLSTRKVRWRYWPTARVTALSHAKMKEKGPGSLDPLGWARGPTAKAKLTRPKAYEYSRDLGASESRHPSWWPCRSDRIPSWLTRLGTRQDGEKSLKTK